MPAQAAGQIAALANVLVILGPGDPALAGISLDGDDLHGTGLHGTGRRWCTHWPGRHWPARTGLHHLAWTALLAAGEFALVIKGPDRQVVPRGWFVPGRMP